jgi:hypothetical protein
MIDLHPDLWAQGCAMCRAALESSPEGKTIAASLKNGILLMLILPYGLMATFGFIIFRAYRKKSKQPESVSESAQHPHAPQSV